jgi:hypothetical protein
VTADSRTFLSVWVLSRRQVSQHCVSVDGLICCFDLSHDLLRFDHPRVPVENAMCRSEKIPGANSGETPLD